MGLRKYRKPSTKRKYEYYLVVSDMNENKKTILACPIKKISSENPLYVPLDDRTKTSGSIICDEIFPIDISEIYDSGLSNRGILSWYKYQETVPEDILSRVLKIIENEIKLPN